LEVVADTRSKQQGTDIDATKSGRRLLIEVKGYPSKHYRDSKRSMETKRTNPTNQAQQWYSHAMLKVMRLRQKHADAEVSLAFPDYPRFRTLYAETNDCLKKLSVGCIWVREGGEVLIEV
jgi:hypothetical protein